MTSEFIWGVGVGLMIAGLFEFFGAWWRSRDSIDEA
jgi:hypothetical protein